jgi:hypothetical protein
MARGYELLRQQEVMAYYRLVRHILTDEVKRAFPEERAPPTL